MKAATLAEYESLGVILGYRYDGSPICIADGTAPPADLPDRYMPTTRPGARAPHVWLENEKNSILDHFGRGFVLLVFREVDASSFETAAARRFVPIRTLNVKNTAARALYERDLVLVRPDGHVAWRGDEVPADPGWVLDIARGSECSLNSRDSSGGDKATRIFSNSV